MQVEWNTTWKTSETFHKTNQLCFYNPLTNMQTQHDPRNKRMHIRGERRDRQRERERETERVPLCQTSFIKIQTILQAYDDNANINITQPLQRYYIDSKRITQYEYIV